VAVVRLENVCKRFGSTPELAVDSVTLTINDGEFMVLLGPSGCGKSTTLRMIAGLETITAGKLSIDGREMNDVPAKDRDIAMVFQSYALYPHMTVEDNLAFGLRRRGVPKPEIARRVAEVAVVLGLDGLLGRRPGALSGGQRQRVALGRAIVREPKVFLFDEPLSNLDAALRVATRNEIIKLHHRLKATMIYVTHDQVEAMTMGSRICVMNKARVVQIGAPLEVYHNPADTFVARFLGSPPMNLMPGRLARTAEGMVVEVAGSALPIERWSPEALATQLSAGPVMVGVRPEELRLVGAEPRELSIAGTIVAVEPLGAETLFVVDLGDGAGEITARFHKHETADIGSTVRLGFEPSAVYLFDPGTGRAIAADRPPARAAARPTAFAS
jgi:multiple sugar transport system ATP-binding protein